MSSATLSPRRAPRSVERGVWLVATALLMLGCGESEKPPAKNDGPPAKSGRVPDGDPKDPIGGLLQAMSRGKRGALESCVLDLVYGQTRHTVALQGPTRMRRETRVDGRVRLEKLWEGKHWISERAASDGTRTWQRMKRDEVENFERMRLTLGSVLGWDLLASPKITNQASWFRERSQPVIHRDFDESGRLVAISIDGLRWNVDGWHEERGAFLPECIAKGGKELRFERVSIGSRFLDRYFEPLREDAGAAASVQLDVTGAGSDEPKLNFDTPLLEHAHEASYVEMKVPPTWKGRLAAVLELGKKLGPLGQRPDGLPAYAEGKVRVYFAPAEGRKLAAPEGYELRKRAKGNALVLHRRIAFRDALSTLEPLLREWAKKNNYFPAGPVFLRPFELPRQDPSQQPKEGDTVLIRAELPIR